MTKRKFCDFLKVMFLYGLERLERLVFYLEGHKAPFLAYFSINEENKKPQFFLPKPWTNPLNLKK